MRTMKKVAWLLSFVMIVSLIFENVSLTAFATSAAGEVEIAIQNGQSGTVYYQLGGNDENAWEEITQNKIVLQPGAGNALAGFTEGNIYLKAECNDGQSLDGGEGKNTIQVGNADSSQSINIDNLKNGSYYFAYNSSNSYNIQISFANPPSQSPVNSKLLGIGGDPQYTQEAGIFTYKNGETGIGTVTVAFDATPYIGSATQEQNDWTITIPEGANNITLTLTPAEGYTPQVSVGGTQQELTNGDNRTYTYSIAVNSISGNYYSCWINFVSNSQGGEGGNPGDSNPPQNEQGPGTDADNPVKISFRGDASLGTTQYKLGENGTWTTITQSTRITKEALSGIQKIYIKAQPNDTNSLDEGGTGVTENGNNLTVDYNNLKSGAGFALTYTSGSLYDITIEYKTEQGENPQPGPEPQHWTLKLKIGDTEYSDINIEGDGRYKISAADLEKALNNDITVLSQQKNSEAPVDIKTRLGSKMSGTYKPDGEHATLEIQRTVVGENYITVNLQAHYDDLVKAGETAADGIDNFYITNVTFYKEGYKGIKVEQQGSIPDMFSDLIKSATVDLTSSTLDNPQTVEMYFANKTFTVSGINSSANVTIELADTVNPSAVSISRNTVTFMSNFYDEVTFKVTQNGVTGYVKVKRLGLTIQSNSYTNDGIANEILHGTQPGVNWSGTEYAGKYNIVGTFYYSSSESYSNYHLIATLTYADGRVETKEVAGIGETFCVDNNLKGGDYILYSGTKENAPVKVSATAVKSGATTGASFGGACFGNGAGVTATFN